MNETILFLIPFLIQVESGGNWQATGDSGKSLGALQIQAAAWQDGCEALGVFWDYQSGARDPAKAKAICAAYLTRYGKAYERRTGKPPTLEVLARIWNGGPRGYRKSATLDYWREVKAIIDGTRNHTP